MQNNQPSNLRDFNGHTIWQKDTHPIILVYLLHNLERLCLIFCVVFVVLCDNYRFSMGTWKYDILARIKVRITANKSDIGLAAYRDRAMQD